MISMKKIVSLLAALTLLASCAAASGEASSDSAQSVGMANPWTECASLEELNQAAGTNLQLPGVMGVSDAAFRLLKNGDGTLAELDFQVNGVEYTLRASGDYASDISGVYLDSGKTAFEDADDSVSPAYVTTSTMKLARWIDVNAQYVLEVEDNGEMDDETFAGIVSELQDMTNPFQPVELAEGTYDDVFSGRACAIVTSLGGDTYSIEIQWSDSAFSYVDWKMTAVMCEDGTLSYSDCVKTLITTDDSGNVTEAQADLIPSGYFAPISGTSFDWSGAAEESCRDCIFELE